MGINGPNPFWLDVLQMGPYSAFASFFDIDWHPVKAELDGRVLLPILEDHYGVVLEVGKLELERQGGDFTILYHESRLPLATRSLAVILEAAAKVVATSLDSEHPDSLDFFSIWESAARLPLRESNRPEDIDHRFRERLVLPRRIARLCLESPQISEAIDQAVASFAGEAGDPASFDPLHRLLEDQFYRLAHWRVAAQEINYRRFFDINDLAGLRTEDPRVFSVIHTRTFEWVAQGGVSGLRIDHPDGLADPSGYFHDVQEAIFLIRCRHRFNEEQNDPRDWVSTMTAVLARFREAMSADSHPRRAFFPVVVEKILSGDEHLPESWPIDGTVGYEYLNVLNGIFVNRLSEHATDQTYQTFTGDREPFDDLLYRSKTLITLASLASEINALARQLNRVSEQDRRSRDFTHDDLRTAIREVVACFPVYRTYLRPGEPITDRDRQYIERAVTEARLRASGLDPSLFDFLRSILLLDSLPDMTEKGRSQRDRFVVRFQQTTGPVQAKGLEDTAFYRTVRLVSLNEVGGEPQHFGHEPETFHEMNSQRLRDWPGGLSTTATHDTKRGEDARIRINVLSEFPEEWRAQLMRWSEILASEKTRHRNGFFPDAVEEYLTYQALIGVWPLGGTGFEVPENLVERMQEYLIKATREAKRNTSWTDTDPTYPRILSDWVSDLLAGPKSSLFLRDFLPFQRKVSRVGIVHSLAQTLLKLGSPGVADIFQGCELWDFSLVDPDNRRPVDYAARVSGLEEIARSLENDGDRAMTARRLLAEPETGLVKMYVVSTALKHRRTRLDLYQRGDYESLQATGDHERRVVAFSRTHENRSVVVVAPRLVAPLMGPECSIAPIGERVWGNTRLSLGDRLPSGQWHDLLTDRHHQIDGSASVAELFVDLPVALLEFETA